MAGVSRPPFHRRDFIAVLATAALTVGAFDVGAQSARVYRIGILETVPAERNHNNLDALLRGLRERGYVEGQNLRIEYRSADGRAERFLDLATELVHLPVDLIVTRGTPAAKAAQAATEMIPIVMAAIAEPLGIGVVASLARPGGNVTGLSAFATELAGKRVELLKEASPSIARVGFLQNMGNPASPPQWEAVQAAAKALGLSAEPFDVRSTNDIANAFARIAKDRFDALSVGIDALTQANAKMIVELAAAHKLLTAYPAREFVDAGGLLSYGPSYPDLYYRAAGLIDKIFKGAKPGDLPVEQPTKLEVVINLKTAKTLGVEIPPNLLARADEVIE
jgi:putative tryptophan/tyrosine transport system substrate-binding protein